MVGTWRTALRMTSMPAGDALHGHHQSICLPVKQHLRGFLGLSTHSSSRFSSTITRAFPSRCFGPSLVLHRRRGMCLSGSCNSVLLQEKTMSSRGLIFQPPAGTDENPRGVDRGSSSSRGFCLNTERRYPRSVAMSGLQQWSRKGSRMISVDIRHAFPSSSDRNSKRSSRNASDGVPVFDFRPSVRTIRKPLCPDSVTASQAALDYGQIGEAELSDMATSGSETVDPLGSLKTGASDSLGAPVLQAQDMTAKSLLRPVLKRGMPLPEKWNSEDGTVVLIDKPQGWTSFDVCAKIRRSVRVKKVGHAGTLDPMATGLLVVCVGHATKQADSYQALSKVYTGTLRLGEATASCDADSPVNQRKPWDHITENSIQIVKEAFMGDISQIPPMFSAIKVDGERLYEKARRGEHINVPARKVSIYEFEIWRSKEDRQELDFRICCSKGTYIRSLVADFGTALNSCAHLTRLRREKIGDLSVDDAWDVLELEETYFKMYQKPPLEL